RAARPALPGSLRLIGLEPPARAESGRQTGEHERVGSAARCRALDLRIARALSELGLARRRALRGGLDTWVPRARCLTPGNRAQASRARCRPADDRCRAER